MKEYIEREAAIDAIKSAFFNQQCDCEVMPYVFKRVQEVEVADVAEVRHGRWIDHHSGGSSCSACKRWVPYSHHPKYCEACGALMDGKESSYE